MQDSLLTDTRLLNLIWNFSFWQHQNQSQLYWPSMFKYSHLFFKNKKKYNFVVHTKVDTEAIKKKTKYTKQPSLTYIKKVNIQSNNIYACLLLSWIQLVSPVKYIREKYQCIVRHWYPWFHHILWVLNWIWIWGIFIFIDRGLMPKMSGCTISQQNTALWRDWTFSVTRVIIMIRKVFILKVFPIAVLVPFS